MSITENELKSELRNLSHVDGNKPPLPYSTTLTTSHLEQTESELMLEAVYAAYLILRIDATSREQLLDPWLKMSAERRAIALEHVKSLHAQWRKLENLKPLKKGLSTEERDAQLAEYGIADYTAQLYTLTRGEGIGDWTAASAAARNAARVESWLACKRWVFAELHLYARAFGSQETDVAEQRVAQALPA